MRCTSPRTVGFQSDGSTISFSPKQRSKEYAEFQLPCGKCLQCRLDYARQWAVRCVHEAQMHPKNSFITLTYDDQHLASPKLIYDDFQKFMKRLRKTQNDPMGVFVTGEYGELTKRPHWHAILFNYEPTDGKLIRTNERGDKIFQSASLQKIWGKGLTEYGSVTFQSAGYCARYAAKKLVHGNDQDHDYHPISKKSSKHAIGKKWLEKYADTDCFTKGLIVLPDGTTCGIPRYYEKWLKANKPDLYLRYVTQTKLEKIQHAAIAAEAEKNQHNIILQTRREHGKQWLHPLTPHQRKAEILKAKFKQLQTYLKL